MLTEVPEGWASKTVEDICRVFRGASPRPKGDPRFYGGSVPRLMVEDVSRDGKFVTPRVDSLTELGATKSRPVKAGSLVMVCSGVVGVPAIVDIDCCIHDGFLSFDDIDEECERDFLFYNFSRLKQQLDYAATHGGVFTNLTTSIVKEFQLLLPPLPEQRKIAEIMGSVDEAIRATESVIEQTRRVKEGLLQELLTKGIGHTRFKKTPIGEIPEGWEVKRLGDIASFTTGKLDSNAAVDNGRYPFFTCARETSRINSFSFDREALLLAGNNARGEYSVKHFVGKFDAYQRTYVIGAVTEKVTYRFLRHALESQLTRLTRLSTGSATKFLTLKVLNKLPMLLPPIAEQEEIASVLDSLETLAAFHQSEQLSRREMKQGLLQDLLTGKVRVSV